jgi:WD40 repeat protein/DNA-binding SARP family transcriptional activator
MLEVRLLGQFEVCLDGEPVPLPSRPAQSLLAYLALSAGTAHRREKLAGLHWPEADDEHARSYLRHALWRIRKVIETDQRAVAPYILSDDLSVAFNSRSDYWLDAAALEQAAVNGPASVENLTRALAVYRGELLPGFYDEWVAPERGRVETVFHSAMRRLIDGLAGEGRWAEILDWAERWIVQGHAPEPGFRALMIAHAELGNRKHVAETYQRCRQALFDELGVEPSDTTLALYERLARGEQPPARNRQADPPARQAPAPGEPPYQGLQPFEEVDAERFFGRELVVARLLGRLATERILAVVGASGSGKSSVVRAGLVPALRRGAVRAHGTPTWDIYPLTPTSAPLSALARSLIGQAASEVATVALAEDLGRDPRSLRLYLDRAHGPGHQALVVVDQFEELFTVCHDAFEREAFVDNLLIAADAEADAPGAVVLALRADFYAHCAEYPALRDALAQHQEYLGPMGPQELRRAIEGPALAQDWHLERGLVDLLLRDAGEEPGALPLLSHALLETWHRRQGRALTLEGYASSGGVRGAIARTAEEVLNDRLAPHQQAVARRILLQLTELGQGTQETRRRVGLDELVRRKDDQPAVEAVLHVLAAARLVTLGDGTAEVAHEALIREWPTLRRWLDEDRDGLRLQRQLGEGAREWERLGRDPDALYRGTRLAQAIEWAAECQDELSLLERDFLGASRELAEQETAEREAQRQRELDAERRTAQQLRRRAVYLAIAFVFALGMAGIALVFGDQARQQMIRAEAIARMATARELAAAAIANLPADPERGALLALEAVNVTYALDHRWVPEAEDALHQAVPLLRAPLTLAGHTDQVVSVGFSPDGQRVVTASKDGTARVWDAFTGAERMTLRGHAGPVTAVAFSPDGTRIVTGGDDATLRVWDTADGRERLTLAGHQRTIRRLAVSPDGTRVASTSDNGTVRLWDPESGTELLTFDSGGPGAANSAFDIAFSPDGGRLATVSENGMVREWDMKGNPGSRRMLAEGGPDQPIRRGIAFSPDGARLAATASRRVTVWSADSGEPVMAIEGHKDQIYHVAFSPDGLRIATASLDHTAKVWDSATGQELLTLRGHQSAIHRLTFSPDSRYLATASWDGTAKVWDLGPPREALALSSPMSPGRVAFSPDGTRLSVGLSDGTAHVWDAATGRELLVLRGHTNRVIGTAFGADHSRLATGSLDGTVRLWDAISGSQLLLLGDHTDSVYGVAFSPDGTRIASASLDKTAKVWNAATGRLLLTLQHVAPVASVAFSADGSRLTSGSYDGSVHIWQSDTGALLQTLTGHHDTVWGVSFSPDGTRLATASRDETARVWNVATGQQILALRGHNGTVVSAVFSQDARRIATASRDGTARLWDTQTGAELLTLAGTNAGEGTDGVAFSPDGRQLAVGGDQAVRVYVLPIEDLMALTRSRLTRTLSNEECQRFLHRSRCSE